MFQTQKSTLLQLSKTAVFFAWIAASAQAQTLISHYTLDNTLVDSGTVGIDGALINAASFTVGGVGSFSQALSTNSVGSQNFLSANTSGNAAFGMTAMTIAMWVNVESGANTDRFLSNLTTTSGFDFSMNNYSVGTGAGGADGFNLAFGFNSTSGAVQSADAAYITGEWLFLAVTYDSATSTVNFYSGTELGSLVLRDTASKSGAIVASTANLEIGGTPASSSDRTPAALFNDVRIYNGVLDATALESIRTSAIPEPAHLAMLLGVLMMGLVVVKRRL